MCLLPLLLYSLYLYQKGFKDFQVGYAASMAWALYVNDELVSKYWEYADGIYFTVSDPQFFTRHRGKQLRFSQNGTDFFDTGVKLAPAPSVTTILNVAV